MNKLLQIAGHARQICLRATLFVVAFVATSSLLLAQAPDPQTPEGVLTPGNITIVASILTTVLSFIGRSVPGLSKLTPFVRSIAVGLLVVAVFVSFGWAAVSENTLQFVLTNFAPKVVAFSGIIWQLVKWILTKLGVPISAQAKS